MTFKGFLSVCAALAFSSAEAATDPVYQQVCSVCHAAGVAGAPKVGDTKKWAPLIAEGQVILTAHGYVGIRAMPAKGGKPELSTQRRSRLRSHSRCPCGRPVSQSSLSLSPARRSSS